MSTQNTLIERVRGDTYPLKITVKDKGTGLALDITGNTFLLTVSPEMKPEIANNTFQTAGSITDAVNGKVEFPFASTVAVADDEFFDIQMTAATVITTILQGTMRITQDITK